jgi:hypothetical protein
VVPEDTQCSTTHYASVTTSFKGCCSERAQSSAKAKKTRRFMRMIHRATSASTVIVNLSGAEERKYCTAHRASIVPLTRDAIAGDSIFRRSWRRCIASCGGFRYCFVRPCSRLPFTRTSAQNGGKEKYLTLVVVEARGPGSSGATGRVGMRSWGALVGVCSWGALDGTRSMGGARGSSVLSAARGLHCCQPTG